MRQTLVASIFMAAFLATLAGSVAADNMSNSSNSMMNKNMNWDYLVGSWTCVAKMNAMPNSPAHTETNSMTFKRDLNGVWLNQRYAGKGISFQSYMRWDKDANQLVSVGVDSYGSYSIETSKGMQGGKMILSGTMTYRGRPSPVQDLITKISDTRVRHIGKYQANGKWTQSDDTTCTKNS